MKDTIFLWSNVQSSVELNLKGAIKVQTKPLIWKKPPSLIMIKMKLMTSVDFSDTQSNSFLMMINLTTLLLTEDIAIKQVAF